MGKVLEATLYLSVGTFTLGIVIGAAVAFVLYPEETKQLLNEFKKKMGGE
jgi:ABC-type Fe3+ transport system permease subunit